MNDFLHSYSKLLSLPLLLLCFLLTGCDDQVSLTRTYTVYEAVYMSPDEIRASFAISDPEVLKAPGKIYLYGDYLFINEPGEGIHVINNKDKSNPLNEQFIKLPGTFDLAIKDNALYADSYMDLVVLDIQDINNIYISSRAENIFANSSNMGYYDLEKGIIKDWIKKEEIEVTEGELHGAYPAYFPYGNNHYATVDFSSMQESFSAAANGDFSSSTGVGGSMARFTIAGSYLYTIDQSTLNVFNIQNPAKPTKGVTEEVGWGIETVFPSDGNLFIGSQNGLYIYSLANPQSPKRLSMFTHVQSCDPVVVHDTLAFVTLRGGTECNGFTNQLDVINIKNPEAPILLTSHAMTSPYGLGYDKGTLFICEGKSGLKVFDASDIYTINTKLLAHLKDFDAYDVIPYQDVLILIGSDGLYQFDYSDPKNLKQLSRLTIDRKTPIN